MSGMFDVFVCDFAYNLQVIECSQPSCCSKIFEGNSGLTYIDGGPIRQYEIRSEH